MKRGTVDNYHTYCEIVLLFNRKILISLQLYFKAISGFYHRRVQAGVILQSLREKGTGLQLTMSHKNL